MCPLIASHSLIRASLYSITRYVTAKLRPHVPVVCSQKCFTAQETAPTHSEVLLIPLGMLPTAAHNMCGDLRLEIDSLAHVTMIVVVGRSKSTCSRSMSKIFKDLVVAKRHGMRGFPMKLFCYVTV